MTKKRVKIDASDGISKEELSEAGRVLRGGEREAPPPDLGPEMFTVGMWKGLTQWKCGLCPFDTLESEDAIRRHIAERHLPKPVKPTSTALPIVDRFGNPIIVKH